ncbi:MAG: thioredoxin family protein [Bdellovibrio sp. CG12_big_fil_rev_8_21_14_0_65_39_13]|nr:MAG: thioredoxin family protein [Bdellovibrio sp. CG22_combo_CG10-13_8_21_14_all_39_27]PIQ57629.1 MAG: thioredoxin family protein [Bdellovibrio sp. CG12_big_fil_rev_8_21_14_0_65_39_13]PIR35793.1 MAG: thioredoxin family protein [Bdellovibrio sp. CG11_big_fil_rev_8_21_14_0_20_39_38]PJB52454.1 MAG: thioredoxin family protein [Bdellovibrio sp. CG_4_9_14_3_um_filter_39_7]
MLKIFLLSIFLTCSSFAATIGKPAPDFKLKSHMGKTVSLSEFKGKTVVLEWYNYGCPFVRKHYDSKNMQSLQKKYKNDVIWLAIASSAKGKQGYLAGSGEAVLKYQDEGMAAHSLLLDTDGTVGRLYGAKVTPHMFIVDAQGTLVYEGGIDDILSADPKDVAKAHNYIAQSIDELKSGKKLSHTKTDAYGCAVKY